MSTVDLINACFEGGGAVLLTLNVRKLLRDKTVSGVSLIPVAWWNVWGFWNVYYYWAVSCLASMCAGVGVVLLNTIWLGLALYYRSRERTLRVYVVGPHYLRVLEPPPEDLH